MNSNTLAGRRCPECGSDGPLRCVFDVTIEVVVDDDGYSLDGAEVIEDTLNAIGTDVVCVTCGHRDKMTGFTEASGPLKRLEALATAFEVADRPMVAKAIRAAIEGDGWTPNGSSLSG